MSRSILVRGPNWLGDLAMCTPAFRALRAAFPEDRIHLQLRRTLHPLLGGAPWFDELIPFDGPVRGPVSLAAEARRLRDAAPAGYDLGVCIPDSWSAALVMRLGGVRRLVGYGRAGRGWLLHQREPTPEGVGPRRLIARERYALGLARAAGATADDLSLELFTTPEDEARADALLDAAGLAPGFVALAPGASYGSAKQWPAASFGRVADDAAERGLAVCLLGAPGEEATSAAVAEAMRAPVVDLTGRVDLGTLKSVLRRAAALVCNDAGARHVAVAFGVPCVVVFGPTSLEKTDCNLEQVRAIETDVACRPCYARRCPIDHRCMTRLSPDRVRAALLDCAVGEESPARGRRGGENGGT